MKAKLTILLGVLVGAALFAYALKGVDFSRLSEACRQADYFFLALVIIANLFETFMRGVKWKILLDPANKVRLWDSFRMEAAGLALNNVLPFRLGEILRGTAGAGVFRIPVVTVFATIVAERALDVVALVLLLAIIGMSGNIEGEIFQHKAAMSMLFFVVVAGICAIVFSDRLAHMKLLAPVFAKFPAVSRMVSQISIGAMAFRSWKTGSLAVLAAMLQWFVNSLSPFALIYAFHLQDELGIAHSLVITVASAIACSVPAMPGFFGNYEAGVAAVMGVWGIPKDTAFALAFAGHILGYITITLTGLIFVYGLGYSVSKAWNFRAKANGNGIAESEGRKTAEKTPEAGSISESQAYSEKTA